MNDKPGVFYTYPGDKAKAVAFAASIEGIIIRMRFRRAFVKGLAATSKA